jgi:hypothetical protein
MSGVWLVGRGFLETTRYSLQGYPTCTDIPNNRYFYLKMDH